MNDLDRLLEFLHAAHYEQTDHDDAYNGIHGRTYWRGTDHRHGQIVIRIGSGIGYSGFYCDFYFDEAGRLIDHGSWE